MVSFFWQYSTVMHQRYLTVIEDSLCLMARQSQFNDESIMFTVHEHLWCNRVQYLWTVVMHRSGWDDWFDVCCAIGVNDEDEGSCITVIWYVISIRQIVPRANLFFQYENLYNVNKAANTSHFPKKSQMSIWKPWWSIVSKLKPFLTHKLIVCKC